MYKMPVPAAKAPCWWLKGSVMTAKLVVVPSFSSSSFFLFLLLSLLLFCFLLLLLPLLLPPISPSSSVCHTKLHLLPFYIYKGSHSVAQATEPELVIIILLRPPRVPGLSASINCTFTMLGPENYLGYSSQCTDALRSSLLKIFSYPAFPEIL